MLVFANGFQQLHKAKMLPCMAAKDQEEDFGGSLGHSCTKKQKAK